MVIVRAMNGRAETPEQKRAVVERILAAWEKSPTLRLGQLIENARYRVPGPKPDLFNIEDEALVIAVEVERDAKCECGQAAVRWDPNGDGFCAEAE